MDDMDATASAGLDNETAIADGSAGPAARQLACDLLVVGGGINGAGIARDAAGRGLRVILCEQHDLAQHTSSASTKLIHGGLRYLEYYEFSLVRKALREREILLRSAPHIMWPLRFVMPHDKSQRPAWLIRIGLFIYDHLAQRRLLPASEGVDLRHHAAGAPLKDGYRRGFVYSDGWVDDARLVVLNALDAAERGAHVMTRTACTGVTRVDGQSWLASLRSEQPGGEVRTYTVAARAIVNAAGPWAAQFARLTDAGGAQSVVHHHGLRLVKGSHIIVPRLYDHAYAYLLQNPDRRIIFAIPYQHEFTLIGTTDLDYAGDPAQLAISEEEIAYLCSMANRYFKRQLSAADVVSSYSGVRPLLDDETPGAATSASAVTRDYLLECSSEGAPLLSVWGGKITTYRKLAEEAMALLAPHLQDAAPGLATAWTDRSPLPGGDLEQAGQLSEHADFAVFLLAFRQHHAWLPEALAERYARAYGTRAERLLAGVAQLEDLGRQLAPGLYEAEVHYLYTVEWARTADDVLWRRTKLGLHCNAQHVAQVTEWLAAQYSR